MPVTTAYILTPDDLVRSTKRPESISDVERSVILQKQLADERSLETESLLHGSHGKTAGTRGKNNNNKQTENRNRENIEKTKKLNKKLRVTIICMCIANFANFANFSIYAPIFPPTAMQKGMSERAIGFVIGLYNLVMFLGAPVIGSMISRMGAKYLYVTGAVASAVCAILFGFLDRIPNGRLYVAMCFVTRGSQALGSVTYETAAYTIIAHIFPDAIPTYFSVLMTCACVGMTIGPPIGGALYQFGGYYLPFCVTGALLGLSGLLMWVILTPIDAAPVVKTKSSWFFITRPGTFVLLFTVFIMMFSVTFFEPTLANYLRRFQLEKYQIGFMFLIIPAMYTLTGPLLGYICDKKGYIMTMLIAGPFVAGVAYMFFAPASFFNIKPTLWMFITASAGVGLSLNVAYVPVFPALVITAFDVGYENNLATNGMVSGAMVSIFAFGAFVGATFAGVLVETIGFRLSVFALGMLFFLDTILLAGFALSRRKNANGRDIFDVKRTSEKVVSVKYDDI